VSQTDANPGSATLCNQLNALGATPTCGPYGEQTVYTLPNGQTVSGTRTTLGPAFGSGNTLTANIDNSNFNSLQISLERKASDVTFLLAYTYAKAIDDASAFGDWVNYSNYRLSRALSSYDEKNNFVASYNWAIPFNKWFSGGPSRLTNGWNIVGISRFASGFPITLSESGDDRSLTGDSSNDLPDVIAPVTTMNPRNPTNTYFSVNSFAPETYGAIGNANRRFVIGPGFLNTDFGLEKSTRITESTALEFRAEFFNIFNHAQFMNPSGNFNSSTFGIVTSARDPRIGQLSLKMIW
jgi:hypothetical protein